MATEKRKYLDCRDFPSENNCSLYIAGTEDEVLTVAMDHVAKAHQHENTPELRNELRAALKEEPVVARI